MLFTCAFNNTCWYSFAITRSWFYNSILFNICFWSLDSLFSAQAFTSDYISLFTEAISLYRIFFCITVIHLQLILIINMHFYLFAAIDSNIQLENLFNLVQRFLIFTSFDLGYHISLFISFNYIALHFSPNYYSRSLFLCAWDYTKDNLCYLHWDFT